MKPDHAHLQTEKELAKLERRIERLYKEAHDELEETVWAYFESFEKRDSEMKELIGTIQNGKEWTEADYKQWRLNQMGRGQRFEQLRQIMAERYSDANEVAIAYVNDATPGVYSLNRNYSAYTIDKATGGALTMPKGKLDASWTLFDESTVRRLAVEQPGLMPYYPKKKAIKRGIDLAWGKKQITSTVTSAILQGKSIKGIADDLQKSMEIKERFAAVRIARTATTGAQNAGRMDSYAQAEKMGIKMQREWVASLDSRTRHAHARLDGKKARIGEPFKSELGDIMFPGDPSAKPANVYNCRCTLIAALDDVDTSSALRRDKNGLMPDMTYAQWEASRRGSEGKQLSPYHTKTGNSVKDVTSKYIQNARPGMGKVRYQTGYDLNGHKAEVKTANQLRELFGGKLVLLKESNEQGKKTPDYLWKGKGWEQKTISTAKAADSALRGALKQIADNPGGVVFECADQIDVEELTKKIDERALRGLKFDFDVIVLQNGELVFARRYKK